MGKIKVLLKTEIDILAIRNNFEILLFLHARLVYYSSKLVPSYKVTYLFSPPPSFYHLNKVYYNFLINKIFHIPGDCVSYLCFHV
jgi:hypothetical protein